MLAILLAACGPAEKPAPAEAAEAPVRHDELFGPDANAPEIQWRSSGLGVRILVPGEGTAPRMIDTVRVHYLGRLRDGQVFDDSHSRGQPSDFVVNQLMSGWAAAMPSLKPGGRAIFFIPPSLGYRGTRVGKIPPNSGLIFEVELLAVNPDEAAKR